MKKKIIISGEVRKPRPFTAFALSIFVTGLGQVYCGEAARGIVIMLMRVLAVVAVPCYSVLYPQENMLGEVFAAIVIFVLISLISAFEALACAAFSGIVRKKRCNNPAYYLTFSVSSLAIIFFSFFVFFTIFGFPGASADYHPLINSGDLLVVNKTIDKFRPGETVFSNSGTPLRIIAMPGSTVTYSEGRFSVEGSELARSVYTEQEILAMSITDNDVVSEYNGPYRYAVIPGRDKTRLRALTGSNEYYAAPDDRREKGKFGVLPVTSAQGRFEGVLFSVWRKKLCIYPY